MLPSKQSEMNNELHIDSTHADEPCSVQSANMLKGDCGDRREPR